MKINEIKAQCEAKRSALYDKYGAFFAFGDKQFNEKKKEGVTYVHLFAGLLAPMENARALIHAILEVQKEEGLLLQQQVEMDEYILSELANHECFYTGNYSDTPEQVQSYYPHCTIEDIERVYIENKNNYD